MLGGSDHHTDLLQEIPILKRTPEHTRPTDVLPIHAVQIAVSRAAIVPPARPQHICGAAKRGSCVLVHVAGRELLFVV